MQPNDLPGWPRGLREEMAAAYVGISVSLLRAERKAGRFPAPVHLTPGRVVYLREALDRYLDRAAGYPPGGVNAAGLTPEQQAWMDA